MYLIFNHGLFFKKGSTMVYAFLESLQNNVNESFWVHFKDFKWEIYCNIPHVNSVKLSLKFLSEGKMVNYASLTSR